MNLPSAFDTMRFLRAGRGSSVIGTGLTLLDILATEDGVVLVYGDRDGRRVKDVLHREAVTR